MTAINLNSLNVHCSRMLICVCVYMAYANQNVYDALCSVFFINDHDHYESEERVSEWVMDNTTIVACKNVHCFINLLLLTFQLVNINNYNNNNINICWLIGSQINSAIIKQIYVLHYWLIITLPIHQQQPVYQSQPSLSRSHMHTCVCSVCLCILYVEMTLKC